MMKKQLIMEKALELFAKQGFEATSIQQITEHCGISKGAFYLSFKSKDELILALIDQFMMEILSDVDYMVRNTEDELLLFHFYTIMFESFQKHTDFAKILLKEQMPVNEKFMTKMFSYEKSIDNMILSMLERSYGKAVKESKYDLVYCIKGFLNTYMQFLLFCKTPVDLELLSKSLVEKTNILAKYSSTPFITEELVQFSEKPVDEEITKERIMTEVGEKIEEMEESLEKESLILLGQNLLDETYNPAIVKGLLENIRNHPHCKWISYMFRRYYGF